MNEDGTRPLTPAELYQAERARAKAQGKSVLKPIHEPRGEEDGEMTEAQLEEARQLYKEKYGDPNHTIRPGDEL